MFKRIISLSLCLVMLAVLFAGCGKKNTTASTTTTNTDDLPMTINLIGITDKSTTQAAIDAVETALNKITKTRYKTKIELTLVTADEYIAEIEKRVAQAEQSVIKVKAITKYNSLAQKQANNAQKLLSESNGKNNNKWASQVTTVIASTMTTGEVYTAEQTTVYDDGKIETVYPSAQSPVDIIMIDGKEMYDYLNDKGYLLSIEKKLNEKFTKFKQYIYPTFFDQLKAMTGDINAIPNNNLLAEYTYLLIDKEISDGYNDGMGFNIDNVDGYADLADFLAYVKDNYGDDVAPLATKPDALGVYKYMDGDVAIGAYFDPIYGYSTTEGTDFTVQNLLSIPQYQAHVQLMQEYEESGYINTNASKFAVNVIKGDASVVDEYSDKYDIKVIQNPFVTADAVYDGMMAVSSYTSSEDRALEIIEMFTTDRDAKNIFQYGILDDGDNTAYANYKLVEVEDGKFTVQRISKPEYTYIMDNGLTGNVYMGYPEEGQNFDAWTYDKQTNLDSKVSPFLLLYVEETELDNVLQSVVKRAALTEALSALGIDYNSYLKEVTNATVYTAAGLEYIQKLRASYITYLISELEKAGATSEDFKFVTASNANATVKEFVEFATSKQGQEILVNAGYTAVSASATDYQKKANISGEITLFANTGTSARTYLENAFNGLADAFVAMYPNVTITRPVFTSTLEGYNSNFTTDLANNANGVGMTYVNVANTFTVEIVAKSFVKIFNDTGANAAFKQYWYENKIIEKVKAEKYADIISASDLEKMIQNKVAIIAGAGKQKGEADTERLTFATVRDAASNYYTNIKYLRVMADLILFDGLTEAERAAYDSMTDQDFEAAVYDYVKAHYNEENNIKTDEEYRKRVREFMASVLEFTSEEDSTTKYLVSWEEFEAAEAGAGDYLNAAQSIVDQYMDVLKTKYNENLLKTLSLDKLIEYVYNVMYDEYLVENGYSEDEFEEMVQNKYLKAVGTNAEDFKTYKTTSDEYKNYVNKLRKKFKAQLIEIYSANAYKNGEKGISNEKVVEGLYDYFMEQELGIYDKMAGMVGMSKDEFLASEKNYANYSRYINTMKTKYVYTLRTKYTQNQINGWSLAEAKENIFNILYETGFYTNELARYIGLELSEYMLAKSDAVAYQDYLKKIATDLADEFAAKGYDTAILLKNDGSELEAIAKEIVAEKYFSNMKGVTEVIKGISGQYVKDYTDVAEMQANADKLSADSFFMAVVNELQAMWDERRAELEK